MPKLVAIVGQTASGKSDLALNIAKEFNGEIISADSRAIYRGMDIGTSKPSKTVQKQIKHYGLDLATPDNTYTVAEFQKYAEKAIENISNKGKLPIIVGGSGIYNDSVIFSY